MFKPTEKLKLQIDYLERQRKHILSKKPKVDSEKLEKHFLKFFVVAVISFILFWVTMWIPYILVFVGSLLYVIFRSSLLEKQNKKLNASLVKFRGFYKNEIILSLLKEVDENVSYSKDGSILAKHREFNVENLVDVEDLVEMNVSGVGIDFGEIVTEHKDEDSGNKVRSRSSMCVVEFNKNFKSPTFVFRGNATSGKILSSLLPKKAKKILKDSSKLPSKHILLDDPVFNKNFMVFTDDEIEARFILTHTMMEKLVKLGRDFPFYAFVFLNNKIMFNTPSGERHSRDGRNEYDLFDYNVEDSILNQTNIHKKVIDGVVSVVETLELDKKIWK